MQTIVTKFLPHTNTLPARIKATATNGQSLTRQYNHVSMDATQYAEVAMALAARMQWEGEMLAGGTKDGYVFVFSTEPKFAIPSERNPA